MTLIVSVVLAIIITGLKPAHDTNEAIFKKRDILSAVKDHLPGSLDAMSDKEVFSVFDQKMEQLVLDANGNVVEGMKADDVNMAQEEKKPLDQRLYPLYIFNGDKGKLYLASVRGNGLWDKIWGTIAFEQDFNTISGVTFDHVTETAGMGAEIKDNPAWKGQYIGRKIFENEEYVSIKAVKGGIKVPDHEIDAIAGATMTLNGVNEMMERGLKIYLPFFEAQKQKMTTEGGQQ
jgi:Na+-transporting NADH:ubiquinone oxidoreductase subunit C